MSLVQLAEASGVSRAMLSRVERGGTSPTLPIASRIARGLSVSLSALIGEDAPRRSFSVVRSGAGPTFTDRHSGFVRELLTPVSDRPPVEVARHIIPPGSSSGELPPYAPGTTKVAVVERGTLEIVVGGQSARLGEGDVITFDAAAPHMFANPDQDESRYLLIVVRTP